ncbi:response regulator [Roseiarcaceae bacterium H3SJ34-1]|uniref:response regulator n=1 Tax=Terripilifer ovatus TaxID=3032367 RepID=UPI003AB96692|nr:response regulator [Roseiarcaceae bacterium H3SJ34-1]
MPQLTNSKAILVVEDEPLIRLDTTCTLEAAGFKVVEAENADEALHQIRHNPEIGLVITDINMPGTMSGLALAMRVRELWPRIRVVVASGQSMLFKEVAALGLPFLRKPVQTSELTQTAWRQLR